MDDSPIIITAIIIAILGAFAGLLVVLGLMFL